MVCVLVAYSCLLLFLAFSSPCVIRVFPACMILIVLILVGCPWIGPVMLPVVFFTCL